MLLARSGKFSRQSKLRDSAKTGRVIVATLMRLFIVTRRPLVAFPVERLFTRLCDHEKSFAGERPV
jgi:hypothetical protein